MARRLALVVVVASLGCGAPPPPASAPSVVSAAPPASTAPVASAAPTSSAPAPVAPPPSADPSPPTGYHVVARADADDSVSDLRIADGQRLIIAERAGGCDVRAALHDGSKVTVLPWFAKLVDALPSAPKGRGCSVTDISAASVTDFVLSVDDDRQCHVVALKAATFTLLGTYAKSDGAGCGPVARFHGGALAVAHHADASAVPTLRAFGAGTAKAPDLTRYRGASREYCGSYLTTIWAMRAFDDGTVVLVGTPCGIPHVVLERIPEKGARDLPIALKLVIDHPSRVRISSSRNVELLSAVGDDGLIDVGLHYEKRGWVTTPTPPKREDEGPPFGAWQLESSLRAIAPELSVLEQKKPKGKPKGQKIVVTTSPVDAAVDFRKPGGG